MPLTKEDLSAIQGMLCEALAPVQKDIAELKRGQAEIRADIKELKEHAEVTRSAANSLVKWADEVAVITQVRFPVKKAIGE